MMHMTQMDWDGIMNPDTGASKRHGFDYIDEASI